MTLEPAAGGELRRDAGGQEHEADGEGADDPTKLHAAFEHEPVQQGQDEDQDRCFGEESRTAMRGDGDQVDEGRRAPLRSTSAS